MTRVKRLGVLGGMGPYATLDFVRKVIESTDAACEQDGFPIITVSDPTIPDRTAAILGRGPSPLPALQDALNALVRTEIDLVAIACNTAHYWHAELCRCSAVPILHIADAVAVDLAGQRRPGRPVGLLATPAMVGANIYQDRLRNFEIDWVVPDDYDALLAGIWEVKADRIPSARRILKPIVERMRSAGCATIILGCTELPIVLGEPFDEEVRFIDASAALARACVRHIRTHAS